uniref:Retrovirus-related Pol polyprotein from transposon TNT 1-94-like beta-barrel domain-containing protein n=1 Tax=Moniliophthora roreri TaxID=221103 RepID=A0A0W0FRS7_MONRR
MVEEVTDEEDEIELEEPDQLDHIDNTTVNHNVTVDSSANEETFSSYSMEPPVTPPGWLMALLVESPFILTAFVYEFQGILDSGSSKHLFNDSHYFWDLDLSQMLSIRTANCGSMETCGRGLVKIQVKDICYPDKSFIINLDDAHYTPECLINLFSFGSFLESGMQMYYEGVEGRIYMKKPSPCMFGVHLLHRLLFIKSSFAALPIPSEDILFAALAFPVRLKDWLLAHDILGHPDDGILDQGFSAL